MTVEAPPSVQEQEAAQAEKDQRRQFFGNLEDDVQLKLIDLATQLTIHQKDGTTVEENLTALTKMWM